MGELQQIVSENFTRYAGNVILDRAICDVRDMLKPSARMLTYSQVHITKNIPSKPFVKSARVVGDCLGHYYTHGDASCYSTYMRMAKPFAMRYPLEECQGNSGTITTTGDEAAPRYTELRLSKLGYALFEDIEKNTIKDWYDNFDETEKYPKVLCSKGFYNIVNGSQGIGVSLSASIPSFNLKEINNAMCKLIINPEQEIDIMPDFATGGVIINEDQVRDSLRAGHGKACKIRSVIEFDTKEKAFIVKEVPYGVYTNTISAEIAKLLETNPNCGIDRINDGSGKTPDYIIYLSKTADPNKVLKLLYKNTSLQSYYSINMTVLTDNGRVPKVLGLKDMLLEHITHEKEVYRRGFEFDLNKIKKRIHIIDGLLICIDNIDEIIKIIKGSTSSVSAAAALKSAYSFDDEQVKAILDIKLSRLAHLEVNKLKEELANLLKEKERIEEILANEELFNQQLINGWNDIANKFGDERRTKVMNLEMTEEDEPIEEKTLIVNLSNKGTLYTSESSTLLLQSRGGVGDKFKLEKDEVIIKSLNGSNMEDLLLFSNYGKVYKTKMSSLLIGTPYYPTNYFNTENGEYITNICSYDKSGRKYIVFTTKQGLVKKSLLTEYKIKRINGVAAIKLKDGDSIVSINFVNDENIGLLTRLGFFVKIDIKTITPVGRLTYGVQGIKLSDEDEVICSKVIPDDTIELVTATKAAVAKRTTIDEYPLCTRATKGSLAHDLKDGEMACFTPLNGKEKEIIAVSSKGTITIPISQIQSQGRRTVGVILKRLLSKEKLLDIIVKL